MFSLFTTTELENPTLEEAREAWDRLPLGGFLAFTGDKQIALALPHAAVLGTGIHVKEDGTLGDKQTVIQKMLPKEGWPPKSQSMGFRWWLGNQRA